MTEPIIVLCTGVWYNIDKFQEKLDQHPPNEPLILDCINEGHSLHAFGVVDVVNQWLTKHQKSPSMVCLHSWVNPVEFVPYRRMSTCSKISHCFEHATRYWQHTEPTLEQQLQYQKLFGLFIGRMSTGRSVILYQALTQYTDHVYVSRAKGDYGTIMPWRNNATNQRDIDFERVADWMPSHDLAQMYDWYDHTHIPSVDNEVTNQPIEIWTASLLRYYHNFAVEIVCETCVHGDAFFPTEKSLRPIMAAKPIIVFGPRYYLARLRGLGFKTYHDLWDESYDLYQGPARWQLMRSTIDKLLRCTDDEQKSILIRAHEIAVFNRQRLSDICKSWNRVPLMII